MDFISGLAVQEGVVEKLCILVPKLKPLDPRLLFEKGLLLFT
jgi:hypothetical protein